MNFSSLTAHGLRRAAELVEKIDKLKAELAAVVGSPDAATTGPKRKYKISDAGRLAIVAAQKARWARTKATAKPSAKKPVKRTMSAAARAKIAAAAKARWAKAKAAGKTRL